MSHIFSMFNKFWILVKRRTVTLSFLSSCSIISINWVTEWHVYKKEEDQYFIIFKPGMFHMYLHEYEFTDTLNKTVSHKTQQVWLYLNKMPMGHIAHLWNQFKSIYTYYDYSITQHSSGKLKIHGQRFQTEPIHVACIYVHIHEVLFNADAK